MISFVRGKVADIAGDSLVIDLGGVGLEVYAPFSMLQPAPVIGEDILLYTHLQMREDSWQLYGFTDKDQLTAFRLLLSVSGVGAKTALAIVDQLHVQRFATAIAAKDSKAFTTVSGVGKKTAERIILELKDKFSLLAGSEEIVEQPTAELVLNPDLLSALKQLGYSATESRAFAMKAQSALGDDASPEALLHEAMKIIMQS